MRVALRLLVLSLLVSAPPLSSQQSPTPTGRVAGRVVDRETGRPLAAARVMIVGVPGAVETDLDGRYRTPPLAAGVVSIRAAYIGYRAMVHDSVRVVAGQVATVDFVMTVQAVELEELSVESEVPASPKSDAGLLAAQQAAPGVSDGISAEAISRGPDSDGGDVIRRVTGVTVFDKKFVVVRGLSERYSNTQLNGADLPSPEPLKKVAPLDIFPANLLESIVTVKTATPDKPGDFAGGSVEIRTKEFPDNFTLQLGASQGLNSQTTFSRSALGPRSTGDFFAFGDSRRRPSREALTGSGALSERAMESFRSVWTGRLQQAAPNLGLNLNVGGRVGESSPLGYVVSLTYANKRQFTPDKVLAFVPELDNPTGNGRIIDESVAEVEWGGIANLSFRTGRSKFGLKNIYTRGSEEVFASGPGYNTENNITFNSFGVGYVERELFQSQLSGEHVLNFLWGSRLEWKGTFARATRKEPDNRRANYVTGTGSPSLSQITLYQVRDLVDHVRTGQLDLSIPVGLRHSGDASLKFGGLLRDKPRTFTSAYFQATPTTNDPSILTLPPDQAFAPENVGSAITVFRYDNVGSDYESKDNLTAFYGMADVPVVPGVRLVGGLRVEHWRLDVFNGTEAHPTGKPLFRRPWDYLWSGNLTVGLTDNMNLRFAGFRSVTRPDPRELVADRYTPVASECDVVGDTSLVDSKILNGDARWEYYPRAGELFAVSGFYKRFTHPLVEVVGSGASACTSFTANGIRAHNTGLEFEARRALDFLPGFLGDLSLGANATVVSSGVDLDPGRFGNSKDLPLQGQSPFLFNGSLVYLHPRWGTTVSVLYNYFATRIARYGSGDPANPTGAPPTNVLEQGRYSLDFKLQQAFGPTRISIAGTNLTNRPVLWALDGSHGKDVTRRYRSGTSWSLGVTYNVY